MAFSFILSDISRAPAFAQIAPAPVKVPISVVDPRKITLPEGLGIVQSSFLPEGQSGKFVIYLQGAHANYDSETNTRKLIEFFQKEYHLPLVLLEGGEGELDSLFFKSFPDQTLKEKILNEYLRQGDLSGGEVASIGNNFDTKYYGIETRALYQQNKQAFLNAIEKEKEISEALDQIESELNGKISQLTAKTKEFLEKRRDFQKEKIDLLEYVKILMSFPRRRESSDYGSPIKDFGDDRTHYPELTKLLEVHTHEKQTKSEEVDITINRMIQTFQKNILSRLPKPEQMEINQLIQLYRIGQLSEGMLVKRLQDLSRKHNFFFETTEVLKPGVKQAQTLSSIKGTKIFDELEALEDELRNSLPKTSEEKNLLNQFRELELLRNFAKLELTPKEWQEVKTRGNLGTLRLLRFARNDGELYLLFTDHFEFYHLAEARDEILFQNALKVMNDEKASTALLSTGGFHAQGITGRLKANGISYLVVSPNIREFDDRSLYLKAMKNERSFMSYFRGSFWDALARDYSEKIVSSLQSVDRPNLKLWRDRIIQNLVSEERVTEAGEYTRYVDALVSPDSKIDQSVSTYFSKMEDLIRKKLNIFGEGLKEIWSKDITPEAVSPILDRMNQVKMSNLQASLILPNDLAAMKGWAQPGIVSEESAPVEFVSERGKANAEKFNAKSEDNGSRINVSEGVSSLPPRQFQRLLPKQSRKLITSPHSDPSATSFSHPKSSTNRTDKKDTASDKHKQVKSSGTDYIPKNHARQYHIGAVDQHLFPNIRLPFVQHNQFPIESGILLLAASLVKIKYHNKIVEKLYKTRRSEARGKLNFNIPKKAVISEDEKGIIVDLNKVRLTKDQKGILVDRLVRLMMTAYGDDLSKQDHYDSNYRSWIYSLRHSATKKWLLLSASEKQDELSVHGWIEFQVSETGKHELVGFTTWPHRQGYGTSLIRAYFESLRQKGAGETAIVGVIDDPDDPDNSKIAYDVILSKLRDEGIIDSFEFVDSKLRFNIVLTVPVRFEPRSEARSTPALDLRSGQARAETRAHSVPLVDDALYAGVRKAITDIKLSFRKEPVITFHDLANEFGQTQVLLKRGKDDDVEQTEKAVDAVIDKVIRRVNAWRTKIQAAIKNPLSARDKRDLESQLGIGNKFVGIANGQIQRFKGLLKSMVATDSRLTKEPSRETQRKSLTEPQVEAVVPEELKPTGVRFVRKGGAVLAEVSEDQIEDSGLRRVVYQVKADETDVHSVIQGDEETVEGVRQPLIGSGIYRVKSVRIVMEGREKVGGMKDQVYEGNTIVAYLIVKRSEARQPQTGLARLKARQTAWRGSPAKGTATRREEPRRSEARLKLKQIWRNHRTMIVFIGVSLGAALFAAEGARRVIRFSEHIDRPAPVRMEGNRIANIPIVDLTENHYSDDPDLVNAIGWGIGSADRLRRNQIDKVILSDPNEDENIGGEHSIHLIVTQKPEEHPNPPFRQIEINFDEQGNPDPVALNQLTGMISANRIEIFSLLKRAVYAFAALPLIVFIAVLIRAYLWVREFQNQSSWARSKNEIKELREIGTKRKHDQDLDARSEARQPQTGLARLKARQTAWRGSPAKGTATRREEPRRSEARNQLDYETEPLPQEVLTELPKLLVGNRIRAIRAARGHRVVDASKGSGISSSTYVTAESEERKTLPFPSNLLKLSKFFKVDPLLIIFGLSYEETIEAYEEGKISDYQLFDALRLRRGLDERGLAQELEGTGIQIGRKGSTSKHSHINLWKKRVIPHPDKWPIIRQVLEEEKLYTSQEAQKRAEHILAPTSESLQRTKSGPIQKRRPKSAEPLLPAKSVESQEPTKKTEPVPVQISTSNVSGFLAILAQRDYDSSAKGRSNQLVRHLPKHRLIDFLPQIIAKAQDDPAAVRATLQRIAKQGGQRSQDELTKLKTACEWLLARMPDAFQVTVKKQLLSKPALVQVSAPKRAPPSAAFQPVVKPMLPKVSTDISRSPSLKIDRKAQKEAVKTIKQIQQLNPNTPFIDLLDKIKMSGNLDALDIAVVRVEEQLKRKKISFGSGVQKLIAAKTWLRQQRETKESKPRSEARQAADRPGEAAVLAHHARAEARDEVFRIINDDVRLKVVSVSEVLAAFAEAIRRARDKRLSPDDDVAAIISLVDLNQDSIQFVVSRGRGVLKEIVPDGEEAESKILKNHTVDHKTLLHTVGSDPQSHVVRNYSMRVRMEFDEQGRPNWLIIAPYDLVGLKDPSRFYHNQSNVLNAVSRVIYPALASFYEGDEKSLDAIPVVGLQPPYTSTWEEFLFSQKFSVRKHEEHVSPLGGIVKLSEGRDLLRVERDGDDFTLSFDGIHDFDTAQATFLAAISYLKQFSRFNQSEERFQVTNYRWDSESKKVAGNPVQMADLAVIVYILDELRKNVDRRHIQAVHLEESLEEPERLRMLINPEIARFLNFRLTVQKKGDLLKIHYRNNGQGFNPQSYIGLDGLKERMERVQSNHGVGLAIYNFVHQLFERNQIGRLVIRSDRSMHVENGEANRLKESIRGTEFEIEIPLKEGNGTVFIDSVQTSHLEEIAARSEARRDRERRSRGLGTQLNQLRAEARFHLNQTAAQVAQNHVRHFNPKDAKAFLDDLKREPLILQRVKALGLAKRYANILSHEQDLQNEKVCEEIYVLALFVLSLEDLETIFEILKLTDHAAAVTKSFGIKFVTNFYNITSDILYAETVKDYRKVIRILNQYRFEFETSVIPTFEKEKQKGAKAANSPLNQALSRAQEDVKRAISKIDQLRSRIEAYIEGKGPRGELLEEKPFILEEEDEEVQLAYEIVERSKVRVLFAGENRASDLDITRRFFDASVRGITEEQFRYLGQNPKMLLKIRKLQTKLSSSKTQTLSSSERNFVLWFAKASLEHRSEARNDELNLSNFSGEVIVATSKLGTIIDLSKVSLTKVQKNKLADELNCLFDLAYRRPFLTDADSQDNDHLVRLLDHPTARTWILADFSQNIEGLKVLGYINFQPLSNDRHVLISFATWPHRKGYGTYLIRTYFKFLQKKSIKEVIIADVIDDPTSSNKTTDAYNVILNKLKQEGIVDSYQWIDPNFHIVINSDEGVRSEARSGEINAEQLFPRGVRGLHLEEIPGDKFALYLDSVWRALEGQIRSLKTPSFKAIYIFLGPISSSLLFVSILFASKSIKKRVHKGFPTHKDRFSFNLGHKRKLISILFDFLNVPGLVHSAFRALLFAATYEPEIYGALLSVPGLMNRADPELYQFLRSEIERKNPEHVREALYHHLQVSDDRDYALRRRSESIARSRSEVRNINLNPGEFNRGALQSLRPQAKFPDARAEARGQIISQPHDQIVFENEKLGKIHLSSHIHEQVLFEGLFSGNEIFRKAIEALAFIDQDKYLVQTILELIGNADKGVRKAAHSKGKNKIFLKISLLRHQGNQLIKVQIEQEKSDHRDWVRLTRNHKRWKESKEYLEDLDTRRSEGNTAFLGGSGLALIGRLIRTRPLVLVFDRSTTPPFSIVSTLYSPIASEHFINKNAVRSEARELETGKVREKIAVTVDALSSVGAEDSAVLESVGFKDGDDDGVFARNRLRGEPQEREAEWRSSHMPTTYPLPHLNSSYPPSGFNPKNNTDKQTRQESAYPKKPKVEPLGIKERPDHGRSEKDADKTAKNPGQIGASPASQHDIRLPQYYLKVNKKLINNESFNQLSRALPARVLVNGARNGEIAPQDIAEALRRIKLNGVTADQIPALIEWLTEEKINELYQIVFEEAQKTDDTNLKGIIRIDLRDDLSSLEEFLRTALALLVLNPDLFIEANYAKERERGLNRMLGQVQNREYRKSKIPADRFQINSRIPSRYQVAVSGSNHLDAESIFDDTSFLNGAPVPRGSAAAALLQAAKLLKKQMDGIQQGPDGRYYWQNEYFMGLSAAGSVVTIIRAQDALEAFQSAA